MIRTALLLLVPLLLVPACGPRKAKYIIPQAVLTDLPDGDPSWPHIRAYAARKHAHIIQYTDMHRDANSIVRAIRKVDPVFVHVFCKAGTLDTDLALTMLGIATRIDDDLFTDFFYGFIPVEDRTLVRRYLKTVEIVEYKKENQELQKKLEERS